MRQGTVPMGSVYPPIGTVPWLICVSSQWEDTQMRQGTVPMVPMASSVYPPIDTVQAHLYVPMGGYTDEAGHCTNGICVSSHEYSALPHLCILPLGGYTVMIGTVPWLICVSSHWYIGTQMRQAHLYQSHWIHRCPGRASVYPPIGTVPYTDEAGHLCIQSH